MKTIITTLALIAWANAAQADDDCSGNAYVERALEAVEAAQAAAAAAG